MTDQIIADSGLFGLTVYTNEAGNSVLEFYYYGKPTDTDAFNEFNQSAKKAIQFVGGMLSGHKQITHRAWFYAQPDITESWGAGFTIPYTDVSGGLYTQPKNRPNAVVSAVAKSLNPTARGFDQKNITKKQYCYFSFRLPEQADEPFALRSFGKGFSLKDGQREVGYLYPTFFVDSDRRIRLRLF